MLTAKHHCDACGSKLAPHGINKRCTNQSCTKTHYDNPIVGVAGIHVQDKKILLGKRCGSYKSGLWCIPCGYLEKEDVTDGMIREFQEETGMTPTDYTIYAAHTNYGNPKQLTVSIYYLITSCTGELNAADDLAEARYVSADELTHLPLAFESDKKVVAQLLSDGLL